MIEQYPIYYLQQSEGSRPQLWKVDEERTWGITPLRTAAPRPTTTDRQIWDLNAASGWRKEDFVEPKLAPGHFYQRIARPFAFERTFGCQVTDDDLIYIAEATGQLEVFCRDLDAICRTVQPATQNLDTYGHDIRNLLILACTEVEAHWKGILRLNGRKASGTKQYVDLHKVLKLSDYSVRFPRYKCLGEFSPFESWGDKQNSPNGLPRYASYNGVKHDREKEFHRATLETIFNAVVACAILLMEKFGPQGLGYIDQTQVGLFTYFGFGKYPEWQLSDYYIDWLSETGGVFRAVGYPW